jgi:hypothetical protein
VICITENFWGTQRLAELNTIARNNKIGFILTETMGLAAYTFLDYGAEFLVTDRDGEPTR